MEAEKARVKLAKQDRKEANELLVAVGKEDEARVRRLLGSAMIQMDLRVPRGRVVCKG